MLSNAPDSPSTADRDVGRGLHLSGGVSACITNVSLDRNDAGALLAEGFLTRVFVSDMLARNNSVSPVVREEIATTGDVTSGHGSIEIRDEALLLGEWLDVFSGEVTGLLVDSNASAHIRYSRIAKTVRIAITHWVFAGGRNISVSSGALEMTSSLSSLSDVGLQIDTVSGGSLKASASLVTKNSIGAAISASNSEEIACAQRCLGDTRFPLNNRNAAFSGGFTSPQDLPGDPPIDCSCHSIEFLPSWCK